MAKLGKWGLRHRCKIDKRCKWRPIGSAFAPHQLPNWAWFSVLPLTIRIDFRPCRFCHFAIFAPAGYAILPFYQFPILARLSVLPFCIRINYRPCRGNILPLLRPLQFYRFTSFDNFNISALLPVVPFAPVSIPGPPGYNIFTIFCALPVLSFYHFSIAPFYLA